MLIFQTEKGIAMGSPIWSTMANIYLQCFEEVYIKQLLESREIIYYKRYVDDILIMFDQKADGKTNMNNIGKHNIVYDALLSITGTTNICSHITTDLIIHRCTIIDYLTQCNSRKQAWWAPWRWCDWTETCRSYFNVNFNIVLRQSLVHSLVNTELW